MYLETGFPGGSVVQNLLVSAGHTGDAGQSWVEKIPWRRKGQRSPVFLPGKSQGQKSLTGYSPWNCKMSDMTEQLSRYREYQHKSELKGVKSKPIS